MVAISLYRGNLHRVPDVPREWVMPSRKISVKHFKALLHRRSKALSRLQPQPSSAAIPPNPNPNPNPNPIIIIEQEQEQEEKEKEEDPNHHPQFQSTQSDPPPPPTLLPDILINSDSLPNSSSSAAAVDVDHDIPPLPLNTNSQRNEKEIIVLSDEERKREVEEKLKVLNQRKHNLVQVLKQILNAEEELKRRSSMQGLPAQPSNSLQVDVTTNDSGSMTRHLTPRLGSDGNPVADVEGGDADDASNQNMHSHHTLRMSSISPSSDSIHRRPSGVFANGVPHASRATLGASASPSRFAPTGQQGHPASLPAVSVSGTNYFASSPSPAASSGTSVFRDGRRPSPWN